MIIRGTVVFYALLSGMQPLSANGYICPWEHGCSGEDTGRRHLGTEAAAIAAAKAKAIENSKIELNEDDEHRRRLNLVGSYVVHDGPDWPDDPPVYTCLEACALIFGGTSADYECGTTAASPNNMAWVSKWGGGGCFIEPENFSLSPDGFYDCFPPILCSASAYVRDWCFGGETNYCFEANNPPVAQCKDVSTDSPGLCAALDSFVSIDDGSFDPDGNLMSCVQDNNGPYPIGDTVVTLTCTDDEGLTDSCQGTITVNDVDTDNDGVLDCNDNCPTGDNPLQEDADSDGLGDVCDNCPTIANPGQDLSACVDECTDPCTSVLSDDFDDYATGPFDPAVTYIWESANNARVDSNCGVTSPGNALTFGAGSGDREVISKPLLDGHTDLTLSFSLKIGHAGTDNVCEDADDYYYDQDDEDVDLAFYIDGNWVTYAVFDTEAFNFFTCIEVAIPAGATQFKLFQPSYSGAGFDEWAIDDVQIKSCECCHPLLTATIDVAPPEALYYAANGRTGFVACFSDQYPQLDPGYQDCPAPGGPQLYWNGANGSDGTNTACVAQGAVTDTGGYCIHDGWMPMMGSTCCADLTFTGFVPITGGTQFLKCDQGQECAVQDCQLVHNHGRPEYPDPVQLLFDVKCPWDTENGCCNWPNDVDTSTFSTCMPQGNSDRLLIAEEDDHNLRGAGH